MEVLLYSKFSKASTKLLSQLDSTPELAQSISLICIDNHSIRKQILADQKIKVNVLPCFIRLNEEDNFDVYEGQNAFDFITDLQTKLKEFNQEQVKLERQELERQEMARQEMARQEMVRQEMARQETQEMKHEPERKEEKEKSILQDAKRKEMERNQSQTKMEEMKTPIKSKISTSISSEPIKFTTIDELELESGEGISSYTHIEQNTNTTFDDREINTKKAESTVKVSSVLSKAMQMQKERA
jgi:hypothetical protein